MAETAMQKRKINLSKEKTPIQHLSPQTRIKNFAETVRGFETLVQAQDEARRCLRCPKKPCVSGCPINNDIPEFIAAIEDGNLECAYNILAQKTSLPGVCGRVCPQEKQCEGACTRGRNGEPVDIGNLERFVADWARNADRNEIVGKPTCGKRVAVVGAGPAGLGATDLLSGAGVSVDIYDAREYVGGVLSYGIPIFRLPREVVQHTVNDLQKRDVQFKFGTKIGQEITVSDLLNQYDAVFLGNGAQIPKSAGISGEDLVGVYQALDFLEEVAFKSTKDKTKIVPKFDGKHVVVIGGGNVAMDVAGTAVRCGAKSVTVTYRRSLEELPARSEEVEFNREEGVMFKLLSSPCAILGDEQHNVRGLLCQEVELGDPDESGRRTPVCKIGSEFEILADVIILAIGSDNDISILQGSDVECDSRGRIQVDDNFKTSVDKLWAGGDTVSGPLTVVSAMRAGRLAAKDICTYLKK